MTKDPQQTQTPLAGSNAYVGFNLAKARHELRTPTNHIIGYSEILLEELEDYPDPDWIADLQKIRSSGKQLEGLLNFHFSESNLFDGALDIDQVIFNLRTAANQVIGYTELVIETATQPLPDAVLADLNKIIAAARTCMELTEFELKPALMSRPLRSAPSSEYESLGALTVAASCYATNKIKNKNIAPPLPGVMVEPLPDEKAARILFADDNHDNRRLLTRRLERFGYQVVVVKNGLEALEKLESESFDLALLDLVMPELDGKETLRQLKKDPKHEALPVVIISAMDVPESIAHCIELGAEDYLPSPINPILLQARISAALEKKRLREFERLYLKQIQQEQEKSEKLLLNIIPGPIVDRLKQGEEYVVDDFSDVTVIFADLVGFTALSQTMSALSLSKILNEIFISFDDLLDIHGLEKIKTIGDAYMAVCGLPLPDVLHAEKAAKFALSIMEELKRFACGNDLPLSMRIGIHSGPVSAGIIGRKKFTYDLWGETVNLASRMESQGKPSKIQVSEDTAKLIQKGFDLESRGTFSVRGIGARESYWLISERT